MRVAVERGVFVPRKRTELLVSEALRRVPHPGVTVELCCGAGAVALALAAAAGEVHAVDVEAAAVACARRNLAPAGPRHHAYLGDLYSALPRALRGRVDLLVANAPYVPTDAIAFMPPEAREHEPVIALDGGPDGLDVHRRIAAEAPDWLAPAGVLLIETSDRQADGTAAAAQQAGLRTEAVRDDEATVVAAFR
jgi:release factor glutamine methyltransferase